MTTAVTVQVVGRRNRGRAWTAARFGPIRPGGREVARLLAHPRRAVTAFSCSRAMRKPPSTGSRLSGRSCVTCR